MKILLLLFFFTLDSSESSFFFPGIQSFEEVYRNPPHYQDQQVLKLWVDEIKLPH